MAELDLNATFRDSDISSECVFRTIGLGITPLVLIEPEATEEGVTINLDATDIDPDELAGLLVLIAEGLRQGDRATETSNETSQEAK